MKKNIIRLGISQQNSQAITMKEKSNLTYDQIDFLTWYQSYGIWIEIEDHNLLACLYNKFMNPLEGF